MYQPGVVDLFSGAGGFSLGFQAAGCKLLAAVDQDQVASRTLAHNFEQLQVGSPPNVLGGPDADLWSLPLENVIQDARPDILIGGPPCQGFSQLGRAKLDHLFAEGMRRGTFAEDSRNGLYLRFFEAASLWRPRAVVMENVPGMLNVGGRNVAAEAVALLESLGYHVGYGLLNAVWFGVPQFRERLFVIGIREDLKAHPSMPLATHMAEVPLGYQKTRLDYQLPLLHAAGGELPVHPHPTYRAPANSVKDALSDLPPIETHLDGSSLPRGNHRAEAYYLRPPLGAFERLMRRWPGLPEPPSVEDHVSRRTPRDYEIFRRMNHGDMYPEALTIARSLFEAALAQAGNPKPASLEYEAIRKKIIPPYREDRFRAKWRKLVPDQPSWTVPAHLSKDTYSHIHYDSSQARTISVREAARLQSFPDAYKFMGNMGDSYRQIGNAVPPLLSWAIATHVLGLLGLDAVQPGGIEWHDHGAK